MNRNPRLIYNKAEKFKSFIQEHQINYIFISKSWQQPKFDRSKLFNIDEFTVVSNPHQRKGSGGCPALIINTRYINVRKLTNTVVQIQWGCKATWEVLTPKNASNSRLFSVACIVNQTLERRSSDLSTLAKPTITSVPNTELGSISY